MGTKREKEVRNENKLSQSVQLKKIVQDTYRVVIIGVIFLVLFTGANVWVFMVNSERLESTMFLNQYRLGSKTLTANVQSYAVTGEKIYYDGYMKELNEDKNRDIAWNGLKENDITQEEWAMLEHIAEMSNGLVPLEEQSMEHAAKGELTEAMALVFGDSYEETVQEINAMTDNCIETIQKRMEGKSNKLNIVMFIAELMFIISFVYIVKKIVDTTKFSRKELLEPIVKVSEQMTELAQGRFDMEMDMKANNSEVGRMVGAIAFMKENFANMITEISTVLGAMGEGKYNVEITQEYVGEFVRIKESLLKIVEDMKKTLNTIRQVSQELDSGSEQLARAAIDLAEGSTVQANKVSAVAGMIDEMTKSMEKEAAEASETVTIATHAGETLMEGNVKMQELKEAIGEISHCSERIGTIIGTIQDIASQTNLLSLNAAIEAARAGEAGKGFAVVADQVKNLAEESAEAAGETTKLIEMTIHAVEKGIAIADETAENMQGVMEGARIATEKMQTVAESLKQEAQNMYEIDQNVTKVAEVVDNNSATSQETAAVSEEQAAQVATMVQMMDQFEI
ncbi:MAG: methyl-accepting chemotaxis protein [Acetivibrio ethanolgignens]